MKSLPIASLALVLALSGCASSPSIEEQTKLVEYEKCLEDILGRQSEFRAERLKYVWRLGYLSQEERLGQQILITLNGRDKDFKVDLEQCAKYRP